MKQIRENIRLFDYVNLSFYILVLLIVITHHSSIPNPSIIVVMYIGIIFATIFLIANKNLNRIFKLFRYFYPYIFIGFVFESLGYIIPFISPHNKDYMLIKLDRLILGKDAALIFNVFNVKGLIDYLQISYLAYYFLPLFVIWYFYKRKEIKKLNFSLFAISLGYYTSYIGYMLFPAIGPRYSLNYLENMPLHGGAVFNFIHPILDSLEHIKQDCFPSGHTELSLLVVLIFWNENKKIALIILPIVLSLILATLVLRYHYLTDVIAGIIIAFLVYLFSKAIFFPNKKAS